MSDSEAATSSSGDETDEFSIEDLERMAAEEDKPPSKATTTSRAAVKAESGKASKSKSSKRKSNRDVESDSEQEENDDDRAQENPAKRAAIEAPAKSRPKPSPKKKQHPRTIAVDLEGKERPLPKTTKVIKGPKHPLTYKSFAKKLDEGKGKLNEEQIKDIADGITIFQQRSQHQFKIAWGFQETILPEKFTLPPKKPDALKLVQLMYDAMDPSLRSGPFSEFCPQIQEGTAPGKKPVSDLSAFERAILEGTGHGLPVSATVKRKALSVLPPVVAAAASAAPQEITLEGLAQFARKSNATITISIGPQ